ncbi:cucumisin-like isoform X1 [Fagus crenata]
MAKVVHILLYPLLLAALLLSCHGQERKVHIVYMGERPQGDFSVASTHHSMLARVLGSTSTAKESLIYSYGKSFNGFAAKLTDEEVAKFSEMEGVISVLPNHKLELHTTRSWDFIGFSKGKLGLPLEGDVIIGLLDTGYYFKYTIGLSINSFNLDGIPFPLIWGGDAANYSAGADPDISKFCLDGYMNSDKLQGKIVFCESFLDGSGILSAHGVGIIMADSSITDFAFSYPLPAAVISVEDGLKIFDYIRSTEEPYGTILVGETWNDVMAPYVVSFSSRGPNPITPDILKDDIHMQPDITAPGVDILAAWSPVASLSIDVDDTTRVKFNIISAYIVDPKKHEDVLEFAYGSGHINPLQAVNPGLVYDATEADYIDFLCKQGYNTTTLKLITGDNSSFCDTLTSGRAWNLNYPSFSVAVEDGQQINAVFTRTVRNVRGPKIAQQPIISGALTWTYGVYAVRNPLVVYTIPPGSLYPSFSVSQNKPDFKGSSMYPKNGLLKYKR